MTAGFDPPIFITTRDRVCDLRRLVDWLERAGHERIIFVDNASAYEPLLDFFKVSPHQTVRLARNAGPRAIFTERMAPDEWFVVTDPDIVPVDGCPLDAVAHLKATLETHRHATKAGLGLYLEDVPADMPSLAWERSLVGVASAEFPVPQGREVSPGVYDSLVDTTFALYRPGGTFSLHGLRTGWPYQARHTYWYPAVTDEERLEREFYRAHARGGSDGSSWKDGL